MDKFGFLGDGQNCLCHFDLAARNVLIEISPDDSPTMSGVVDWDTQCLLRHTSFVLLPFGFEPIQKSTMMRAMQKNSLLQQRKRDQEGL